MSYHSTTPLAPSRAWITAERLRWCYGDERARQILSGQCPKAKADLAAWKRLCALGGGKAR